VSTARSKSWRGDVVAGRDAKALIAASRRGRRRRAIVATAQVLVMVALSTSFAVAAARIPSSEPPGLERKRFVDPPGAQLLQPSEPSTVLPWEARPSGAECRPGATRGKRKARQHRRC
jgi:hypothetical protein